MTPAEFRTLRESLGLDVAACCRLFAVADRTVRRWDAGRLPIPEGVIRQLLDVDAGFESIARDAVRKALDEQARRGESPKDIALVRYRTDEDLARYLPDMRLLGTQAHGALADRVRRALKAAGLPLPRIVWMEPDAYEAWRGRRPDHEDLRAKWGGEQIARPPGTPAADSG